MGEFKVISVRSILMLYPLLGFHEIFVNCMHLKTGEPFLRNHFLTGNSTGSGPEVDQKLFQVPIFQTMNSPQTQIFKIQWFS